MILYILFISLEIFFKFTETYIRDKYFLKEEQDDDIKKNPNDNRKICRKPRLFYIEKNNIDNLPSEYLSV